MMQATPSKKGSEKDVTDDFLLCNRCGACRQVCPLLPVFREEWAGARGKVELAELFFRGEPLDDKELAKVFDYCLHCMTCEENCPSGMRADEIVMAVRAEMARRGRMPHLKKLVLWALGGADRTLFKIMRTLGIARRAPLHGVGGKSPLSFLYPILGWPRERFIPLPAAKPFLESGPELYKASDAVVRVGSGLDKSSKVADLIERVVRARERNLAAGKRAYFFVGHAVNHFFPEEAAAVTRLLNILGVDVLAPKDQVCCGSPVYYAGDIERARAAAARMLERFEGREYDWIVTSCSSGGLMLKEELARLFDLNYDGYFEIGWDKEKESFFRKPNRSTVKEEYPRIEDLYRNHVEGRVRDVNELLADLLELRDTSESIGAMFEASKEARGDSVEARSAPVVDAGGKALPVVTYHQPCHLKRGQGVDWQPEAILKMLPGFMYVRMKDFDRCCGGGGSFTFLHSAASEEIAKVKMSAVAELSPDVIATACPLCRIQLMDMIRRSRGAAPYASGEEPKAVPVTTPAELFLEDLQRAFLLCD